MTSVGDVRPSAIAGTWYPGRASDLKAMIKAFLDVADMEPIEGQIVGVMAPHAGYRYSGPVAAYAFKPLIGMHVDVVAIVSPMHLPYMAPILTTGHSAYETPLGRVPVARDLLTRLAEKVSLSAVLMDQEHSLEIELPFLQYVLDGEFRLVPLMLRDNTEATARHLGRELAELLSGENALLVASSDLSHYQTQQVANRLDGAILGRIDAFDPEGMFEVERKREGSACGIGAIGTVMWAAKELGADSARVVRYATSGDVTGDYYQVVGYGAAVFYTRL